MEIQYYITQNVLIDDEIEQDVNSSLSRNKSYFFSNKFNNYDDIRTKSVMILGCGGIGTHVAWNLTTLGIKRLMLNCNIKCIKNFKNLYRQRITQ